MYRPLPPPTPTFFKTLIVYLVLLYLFLLRPSIVRNDALSISFKSSTGTYLVVLLCYNWNTCVFRCGLSSFASFFSCSFFYLFFYGCDRLAWPRPFRKTFWGQWCWLAWKCCKIFRYIFIRTTVVILKRLVPCAPTMLLRRVLYRQALAGVPPNFFCEPPSSLEEGLHTCLHQN